MSMCPDCGADVRSFEPHTRFCKHNQFSQPSPAGEGAQETLRSGLQQALARWLEARERWTMLSREANHAGNVEMDAYRDGKAMGIADCIYDVRYLLLRTAPTLSPERAALVERLEDLAERMKVNRHDVHEDCCDDAQFPVPCASPVCAIEYEAEVLLREAAAALKGEPKER